MRREGLDDIHDEAGSHGDNVDDEAGDHGGRPGNDHQAGNHGHDTGDDHHEAGDHGHDAGNHDHHEAGDNHHNACDNHHDEAGDHNDNDHDRSCGNRDGDNPGDDHHGHDPGGNRDGDNPGNDHDGHGPDRDAVAVDDGACSAGRDHNRACDDDPEAVGYCSNAPKRVSKRSAEAQTEPLRSQGGGEGAASSRSGVRPGGAADPRRCSPVRRGMHGEGGKDDAKPHGGFADGYALHDRLDRGQTLDRNRFDTCFHTAQSTDRWQAGPRAGLLVAGSGLGVEAWRDNVQPLRPADHLRRRPGRGNLLQGPRGSGARKPDAQ